jgi:hypothetical protein
MPNTVTGDGTVPERGYHILKPFHAPSCDVVMLASQAQKNSCRDMGKIKLVKRWKRKADAIFSTEMKYFYPLAGFVE